MKKRAGLVISIAVVGFGSFLACVGSSTDNTDVGGIDSGVDVGTTDAITIDDSPLTCADGGTACGTSCVDLTSDNANCGKCGNACSNCYLGTCEGRKPVAIAAGDDFGCALLAAGTVWCWGGNGYGQLGEAPESQTCNVYGGTTPCRPAPSEVPGLHDVTQVSAGSKFACAVEKDGSVWCWGSNANGELGSDPANDIPDAGGPTCSHCNPVPQKIKNADGSALPAMTNVSAGIGFACASGTTGAYCWGQDQNDQLGSGTDDDGGLQRGPRQVAGLTSPTAISASMAFFNHACAIQNGGVYCWGDNFEGPLGHVPGTRGDVMDPVNTYRDRNPAAVEVTDGTDAGFTGITAIATADAVTCAVRSDKSLSCWGFTCGGTTGYVVGPDCNSDQLPFTAPSTLPAVVSGVASVAASSEHGCAIASDSAVYCWGSMWAGQLGNGAYYSSNASTSGAAIYCPTPIEYMMEPNCFATPQGIPAFLASQISTGTNGTLALGTDGFVYGWGGNGAGQTGHAPSTQNDVNCLNSTGSNAAELCNPNPIKVIGLP